MYSSLILQHRNTFDFFFFRKQGKDNKNTPIPYTHSSATNHNPVNKELSYLNLNTIPWVVLKWWPSFFGCWRGVTPLTEQNIMWECKSGFVGKLRPRPTQQNKIKTCADDINCPDAQCLCRWCVGDQNEFTKLRGVYRIRIFSWWTKVKTTVRVKASDPETSKINKYSTFPPSLTSHCISVCSICTAYFNKTVRSVPFSIP